MTLLWLSLSVFRPHGNSQCPTGEAFSGLPTDRLPWLEASEVKLFSPTNKNLVSCSFLYKENKCATHCLTSSTLSFLVQVERRPDIWTCYQETITIIEKATCATNTQVPGNSTLGAFTLLPGRRNSRGFHYSSTQHLCGRTECCAVLCSQRHHQMENCTWLLSKLVC